MIEHVQFLREQRAAQTTAVRARNRGISVRAGATSQAFKRRHIPKTSTALVRSYAATCGAMRYSGRRDSNPQHSAWKAAATFRNMLKALPLTTAQLKPPPVATTVVMHMRELRVNFSSCLRRGLRFPRPFAQASWRWWLRHCDRRSSLMP